MVEQINPDKFGEGFGKFDSYLSGELFTGMNYHIKEFAGKVPKEEYERIEKINAGYKNALYKAKMKLKGSVNKIEDLVKKMKTAVEKKAEKDAYEANEGIKKEYFEVTGQISSVLYHMLNPEIDGYNKIINTFYTIDAADQKGKVVVKGLDKNLFYEGSKIIEDYFLNDKQIEDIKQKARQQQAQQQEARATA